MNRTGVPAEIDAAQSPRQAVNVQVASPRPAVPVTTRPVVGRVVYANDYALHKVIHAIWLIVGFLEIMLAIRFMLRILGANPENPFAIFVYGLTGPLVAPFATLFGLPRVGVSVFEWSTILAMVVYWLLAWMVTKLLALIWDRPVTHEYVTRETAVPVVEEHVHDPADATPVVHEPVVRERVTHDHY
ncbi:MAG TPA: YggT family protein [Dehalococcoidia bacterium]|nr:YggT family protein [Dehalococcoidia bacterium]